MDVSEHVLGVRGLAASPNCVACPCARNGQPHKPVRAYGSPGGLCIVGEGPGGEEVMQGIPFVGPSGRVVNKGLQQAGIDRAHVWIANALLCRRPSDDTVMVAAVDCCRPRLEADLATGRPTAICALGGTAMRALWLPVTSVSEARGTVQYSPLASGVPVIGSIHPAALLRGGAGEMAGGGKQKMNVDAQALFLFADIAKAGKVASGEVSPEWSDDILVVHEPVEVLPAMRAILADVYEWGMLGLDLEWTCDGSKNALDALGAGADRALITWVGVGCAKRAVSFSFPALLENLRVVGDYAPDKEPSALALLILAMEDESLPKLSHNKQADKAVWEAQVGPIKGRYLDSMLLHHAVCPGIDHDLQQAASQYLCIPPWKVEHAKRRKEFEEQQKAEAKAAKVAEKEVAKAVRITEHEAENARKKVEAEARKAKRIADHEARNAAKKVEKETRKGKKKKDARSIADPRQLDFVELVGLPKDILP